MTWHLNREQFNAVIALDDSRRYEYFIKKIVDHEELWSLKNNAGWVLAGDGVSELVPVWPHPEYAQACAINEWKDTIPERISLERWLNNWLPGITSDDRLIAVFPTPTMKGFVVEANRIKSNIEEELSLYE